MAPVLSHPKSKSNFCFTSLSVWLSQAEKAVVSTSLQEIQLLPKVYNCEVLLLFIIILSYIICKSKNVSLVNGSTKCNGTYDSVGTFSGMCLWYFPIGRLFVSCNQEIGTVRQSALHETSFILSPPTSLQVSSTCLTLHLPAPATLD